MNEHRGKSEFESDKWSERNDAQNKYEQAQKRGEDKRRKFNKVFAGHQQLKSLYSSNGFLEEDQEPKRIIKIRIRKKNGSSGLPKKDTKIRTESMEETGQNRHASELYLVLRDRLDLLQKIEAKIKEKEKELEQLNQQIQQVRQQHKPATTGQVLDVVRAVVQASKGKEPEQ